ncbi:MAG TPA: 5-oxoprolinase/urea amidolyase family protein, partial [Actinotalea sp.]
EPSRRVRAVGDRALLVQCGSLEEVMDLHAELVDHPLRGQVDVLAAATTVLVVTTGRPAAARLTAELEALRPPHVARTTSRVVTLDTVYDGADLGPVSAALGASEDALVRAHSSSTWTAAFGGFAPGFAYLVSDDWPFDVPRRPSPRIAVPDGSVAVAARYSAAYPRSTPGGWQLLGRTDAALWDVGRTPPALVTAGVQVRFRPVRALAHAALSLEPVAGPAGSVPSAGGLVVVQPGPLSLVEDLGRVGHLDLGVSPSGAADRASAVRANRLVGNGRAAAVVETVFGGLLLEALGDQVVAVTGATGGLLVHRPGDAATAGGADRETPFLLRSGEVLELLAPVSGLRSYVGVRGGVDVTPVLGSRSSDVLSGLGPPALQAGTILPVGSEVTGAVGEREAVAEDDDPGRFQVVVGPRADLLPEGALTQLCSQEWRVADASNRVGLRLSGPPLRLSGPTELASEGVVRGAVQIPPSGLPVIFLSDHPVTGGYPVVAVVHDTDLDRLAQLRPGDPVHLVR